MGMNLPQTFKIVELLTPATDAGGRTSIYITLKNARKATIVFHVAQGAANTILLSPLQATAVAGTGSKALTNACPIWVCSDEATIETLVRATDATTYTTTAGTTHKIVVFEIDPALHMDMANAFDCIGISTGASSASNLTEAIAYLEMDYEQATPPTATTD
jgi:hypothetical protein